MDRSIFAAGLGGRIASAVSCGILLVAAQQSQLALEKLVDEVDQEDEYCHSCQVPDGSPDGDDDYDCQGQNDQVLDGIVVCHVHPICRVMIYLFRGKWQETARPVTSDKTAPLLQAQKLYSMKIGLSA